jgi:hypothetical protein
LLFAQSGKQTLMNALMKMAYRPVGVLGGVLGGLLAGVLFKRIWTVVARDQVAPKATDEDRGWVEILLAASVQGLVFGGVKAAIDRAGATGFSHVTGVWPGRRRTSR